MNRWKGLKTACACAGFLFVAMHCDSRRNSTQAAPSAATAAPAATPTSAPASAPTTVPTEPVIPPLPPDARTEDEKNTIHVFKATAASAVFVTQTQLQGFYEGQATEVPRGSGTGFIWDTDGHIVTNFHVVQDARSLIVTLDDHRSLEAKLVGVEPRKDIAVLKIDAGKAALHPIVLPEKNHPIEVGQKVVAIGNPFGLDHTLTTGIVSAIGREIQGIGGVSIRDMVQTDAAINPGNSGGPLIDSSGRLMGMNTMIFSRSGSSAGIGFAVPVSTIARVVPQIIRTGRAEQIGIGIEIDVPLSRELERRAGIRGVIVKRPFPDSPAAKAGIRGYQRDRTGIKLGDVIVALDGKPVRDFDDLYNELDRHRPGDTVEVSVLRDGKTAKIPINVVALP
jgi:S1-C subfamily serine protease